MPDPSRRPAAEAPQSYFGRPCTDLSARYMWMWIDSRLRVKRGAAHGAELAGPGENIEAHYRGWFDPETNELFLVRPSAAAGGRAMRGIPRILDRVLRRRFGDDLVYRAF